MPTYNYHCQDCDAKYSEMRKISERDEDLQCHECGSSNIKRQTFYASEHILKGVGWARDGYRSKIKDE